MLNFPTQDRDDINLLQGSFDLLSRLYAAELVSDTGERDRIYRIIANASSLPPGCSISLVNLFRVMKEERAVFIAQCLHDFRFSVRNRKPIDDSYYYICVGYAVLDADFGRMVVRPEGMADRLVGRFRKTDIDIQGADDFNRKYYVAASDQNKARSFLGATAVQLLAKTKGAQLQVKHEEVIVRMEGEMTVGQAGLIAEILFSVGAD